MLILGLQGSPRKGGNTDTFMTLFMQKAAGAGAATHTIQVARAGIEPCRGCGYCETHGRCVIAKDPMSTEIYGLLREADVVVAASPVYFYGMTAQIKILIDRCQTLWSRKHLYKLTDPLATSRKGVLFGVAASTGKQLFAGVRLTAQYFFDAIDARSSDALCYRGVEAKGAIRDQERLEADIDGIIDRTVRPLTRRKRLLFVSRQGTCRAPLAAALAQQRFGGGIRCDFAAPHPAAAPSDSMVQTMQRIGLDAGYRRPQSLEAVIAGQAPDLTIVIGQDVDRQHLPGQTIVPWPIDAPVSSGPDPMDRLRNEIASRVDTIEPFIANRSTPQKAEKGD